MDLNCSGKLHPNARNGLQLFNRGEFFEAHEELEQAWLTEKGPRRELYRALLQMAVTYLHILRGNYDGALKVFERSMNRLDGWPEECLGIKIGQLRQNARKAIAQVMQLGREHLGEFDKSMLKPVDWVENNPWTCDRCGIGMYAKDCKIICPNCGNRFDCSDLTLYFD
jgi:hypothetical protein